MLDYLNAIRTESARFGGVLRNLDAAGAVPSCPEWSVADLTWHLAEVQYFWASIVGGLLDSPESVTELDRPQDAALPDLFDVQTTRLLEALTSRSLDDGCWSWHDSGHTVGWVLRRQAHEALIHRVDAELAAASPTSVDIELAADGVDEILTVVLDATPLPDWASFMPDGSTAMIELPQRSKSWALELGRFTGTSPNTGSSYDDPALRVISAVSTPTAIVTGPAADLDLWLWGRGSLDNVALTGDRDVVRHIRAAAAEGTQ